MRRSTSRSSLFSADHSAHQLPKVDPTQICKDTQTLLSEASRVLPYQQFQPISSRILKGLIRRAETESAQSQSVMLKAIEDCVYQYGKSVELAVRTQLLEVQCSLNSRLLDGVGSKLQRIKHTLIDTQLEYLLPKALLLQQRFHLACQDQTAAVITLRRCIELNQSLLSEYVQDSEEVRQEIVDHVILAHYEIYRLRKAKKPGPALQSLAKAVGAARRSYGPQNGVVRALERLYAQQEQAVERGSSRSRAITEIVELQVKKGLRASAFYGWEDERIVAQLLRLKDGERQVLYETTYEIKLDINKLKQLKGGEWLSVEGGKVLICEDQLLRLLGVNSQPTKEMTTRIEMRNLSRDQIIRKEEISSQDDNEDVLESEQYKFFKYNRAQSSKRYKETQ